MPKRREEEVQLKKTTQLSLSVMDWRGATGGKGEYWRN